MTRAMRATVQGLVQGVGMRPWVQRQAKSLGLCGFVQNDTDGVIVEAEGCDQSLRELIRRLRSEPPEGAVVDSVYVEPQPAEARREFLIHESSSAGAHVTHVPRDRAPCDQCVRELRDPANRRHQHPFISCVTCGPRFTIVESMPFDRGHTAMAEYDMCPACLDEYNNPLDRRHHAQSLACHDCGPQLEYLASGHSVAGSADAMAAALDCLLQGNVLALKGLGGYQLVCDAADETALQALRQWKGRQRKPFAVMVADRDQARQLCHASEHELQELSSPAAPIVILRARSPGVLPELLNPRLQTLGVMLPASPLHLLLASGFAGPLVVTSGNRSGAPLIIDDAEAVEALSDIAQGILRHDRRIAHMADDSVLRLAGKQRILMRHARGFAPSTFPARADSSGLAMSGHMKAAAAVHTGANLTLMQHVGDLDNLDAQTRLLAEIQQAAAALFDTTPAWLARDMHPDYGSTSLTERLEMPARPVPHHLAHVLALVAEQNVALPVLGVAFDGTGLGTDQSIWGGEFIRIGCRDEHEKAGFEWQRVGTILPFPLPGGDRAIREPRRAALGVAWRMSGGNVEQIPGSVRAMFTDAEWRTLTGMLASDVNCPRTSSIGRLFDALAAFMGLCTHADYDGEAAMLVEAAAGDCISEPLRTVIENGVWDWRPLLRKLTSSRAARGELAACFHAALADMICAMVASHAERRVLLTGGVFQNALLLEQATQRLRAAGREVYVHHDTPPNDGSLALGQALAAAVGHTETPTCA